MKTGLRILLSLCFLQLTSCNNGVIYTDLKGGKNHLIDCGAFSIITPNDFKYKKVQGIDSYIGEIRNRNATFLFDYGSYSPKPPLTKEQLIEESRHSLSYESSEMFFNLIDLKPFRNDDGSINPSNIKNKITNLTLNKINDNIILSYNRKGNCEYYYAFDFNKKEYKIPFCYTEENVNNFKFYDIKIDTIENNLRTVSIWTNKNLDNYSSVNLKPLVNKGYNMELWFGVGSEDKISRKTIE